MRHQQQQRLSPGTGSEGSDTRNPYFGVCGEMGLRRMQNNSLAYLMIFQNFAEPSAQNEERPSPTRLKPIFQLFPGTRKSDSLISA